MALNISQVTSDSVNFTGLLDCVPHKYHTVFHPDTTSENMVYFQI